jgi:hypothetical protein
MSIDQWKSIRRELDLWLERGIRAKFWFRDDDACELTDQLIRLLHFSKQYSITIGLAAIPNKLRPSLLTFLKSEDRMFLPMCHGWNHVNYEPKDRPSEFGPNRKLPLLFQDAQLAYRTFVRYFNELEKRAIFVPPFGRIMPAFVELLPKAGFFGLSAGADLIEATVSRIVSRIEFLPAVKISRRTNMARFDVHIDPIDWHRGTAREVPDVAHELLGCLRLRSKSFVDANQPIGIVTHHLVHNEPIWHLCAELVEILSNHSAVEFLDVTQFGVERADIKNAITNAKS